tara:strand:- start:1 stop:288 length:288 start_codon:yes stop_codon:yes gene_type:complete
MPIPIKPIVILSFGFIFADQIPDGSMNGALATAVASIKRRLEKGVDFMRKNYPSFAVFKVLFSGKKQKIIDCKVEAVKGNKWYAREDSNPQPHGS